MGVVVGIRMDNTLVAEYIDNKCADAAGVSNCDENVVP